MEPEQKRVVAPKFLDGPAIVREVVEQVVEERRILSEVTKKFLKQLRDDMERNRMFLIEFQEFAREYRMAAEQLVDAIETLKSLREMKETNRKLMEMLK